MKRMTSAVLTCLLSVSGCGLLTSEGDPESVAAVLAERLSAHSLDGVPLSRNSDRERFARLVAPLSDRPVAVSVEDVAETGESATARLRWQWDLSPHRWQYTTTVDLVDDGNRWEVDWAPDVLEPTLEEGERLGLSTLEARRGRILGRGGVPLVTERPVVRYGIDKTRVKPRRAAASARRIAGVLDIDAGTYVRRVKAAGPEAFVEALVLRTEDARRVVDSGYGDIPGAAAIASHMPLAPTRDFAAELLGRVGPATAEIIEKSKGRIEVGDIVGLSGLQSRYDERLSGSHGLEVVAVGADDQRRTLFRREPRHGRDLRTSLDPRMQRKAERVLAAVGQSTRSAIVALRASDGAVLAAANGPGNGGLNVATAGRYAPGSTFKVVTALALMRAGVRPEGILPCPHTIEVDGRSFENYDDYPEERVGEVSFRTAFASSCNTALIGARGRLQGDDLREAAAALGLGRDHDLGFPAYFGQVPRPAGETEKAASLIGQGRVLASPLTMAAVAASVRAGRAVVPALLPDHPAEEASPTRPLTEPEAEALRAMMRAVVTEGSGRFLAGVPGEVGAKTGTAEYGSPDANGELRTHAWMIATQGDLAVAVFVEDGESGSATAGPLLEEFLR